MYDSVPYFYGTGRRKKSVARVRLYAGTGKIIINDREIDNYFGLETLKLIVRQPLALTGTSEKLDVICRVNGGGVTQPEEPGDAIVFTSISSSFSTNFSRSSVSMIACTGVPITCTPYFSSTPLR